MNFDKKTPLINVIDENDGNILYYGEGGIGKSTQFIAAFCYYSKSEKIVPIYVECKDLKFSNDNDAIADKIHKSYIGKDTNIKNVQSFFNDIPKQNEYTYYIFVDGFNELSKEKKGSLMSEINILSSNKMRFIVSSRVKENFDFNQTNVKIKPLEKDTVVSYINEKLCCNYDKSKVNDSLIEILSLPFFLNIFVKTYQSTDIKPDIYNSSNVRKADILDAFTQKLLSENRNKLKFKYVINYLLPAIAFKMTKENVFSIDFDSLDDFCENEYYLKKFSKLKFESCDIKDINDIAVSNSAFLKYYDEKFTFAHQIWRDYFCAKHIINCINTSYNEEVIEKDLEVSLPFETEKFVGQLAYTFDDKLKYSKEECFPPKKSERKCECDFESKNTLDGDMSPIEDYMQKHSLIEEKPLSPIATKNLIEIMKMSRRGAVTAKFDHLDLTKTILFDYNYYLVNSSFNGAKIIKETFVPKISGEILSIAISNNTESSAYLYKYFDSYSIYVTSKNHYHNKKVPKKIIKLFEIKSDFSMAFYDSDTKIAIYINDENKYLDYSTDTQEFELKEKTNDDLNIFSFNKTTAKYDDHIISINQKEILIDNKVVYTSSEKYTIMSYSPDSNYLAVGRYDGDIDIFKCDISSKKIIHLHQIFNEYKYTFAMSIKNSHLEFYNGQKIHKYNIDNRKVKHSSNFTAFWLHKNWCLKGNYTIFETYNWANIHCISLFDRIKNKVVDVQFFSDKTLLLGCFNGCFISINNEYKKLMILSEVNGKIGIIELLDISKLKYDINNFTLEFSYDEKSIMINGKTIYHLDLEIDFNEKIYTTYTRQNYIPIINTNIVGCDFTNADFCDTDNNDKESIKYILTVNGAIVNDTKQVNDNSFKAVEIETLHLVTHLANKHKLNLSKSDITEIGSFIIYVLNTGKLSENNIYVETEELIKYLKDHPSEE